MKKEKKELKEENAKELKEENETGKELKQEEVKKFQEKKKRILKEMSDSLIFYGVSSLCGLFKAKTYFGLWKIHCLSTKQAQQNLTGDQTRTGVFSMI